MVVYCLGGRYALQEILRNLLHNWSACLLKHTKNLVFATNMTLVRYLSISHYVDGESYILTKHIVDPAPAVVHRQVAYS